MTLRHIKIFIAVCDTGSTTAAARELYIAQPAVSFAIAELEHYYGQKLFDRISNRLRITEAGRRFLEYSRQIVILFDEMEFEIKNWDCLGSLRIGSNVTIGNSFLPQCVKAFKGIYPDIEIEVTVDNSAKIEQLILNSKLDFALIEGPVFNHFIKSELFMDNSLVFICAADHPWAGQEVEMERLADCSFIMREKDSFERKLLNDLLQMNKIQFHASWQSVSYQAILKAVEKNLGIAAISYQAAKEYLKSGKVMQFYVSGVKLKREFYIVYHQNKFLNKPAKDFMELCFKMKELDQTGEQADGGATVEGATVEGADGNGADGNGVEQKKDNRQKD